MKKHYLVYSFILISVAVNAQVSKDLLLDKYPNYKPFYFNSSFSDKVTLKPNYSVANSPIPELKVGNSYEFYGSTRLYSKEKINILGSLQYNRMQMEESGYNRNKQNLNTFNLSASLITNDSLFNKNIIYSLNLNLLSTNLIHSKKVTISATAFMPLTLQSDKIFTLGVYASADPKMIFPIIPVFSYWQQFENSPWQLDIIFPQKVYLRRKSLMDGWLSIGGTFEGKEMIFKQFANSSENLQLNHVNFLTEVSYEKSFGKLLIGTHVGMAHHVKSSISKLYSKRNRNIAEFSSSSTFYLGLKASMAIIN